MWHSIMTELCEQVNIKAQQIIYPTTQQKKKNDPVVLQEYRIKYSGMFPLNLELRKN